MKSTRETDHSRGALIWIPNLFGPKEVSKVLLHVCVTSGGQQKSFLAEVRMEKETA